MGRLTCFVPTRAMATPSRGRFCFRPRSDRLSNASDLRQAAPAWGLGLLLWLAPAASFACACGCGVFDVGTVSMLPTHAGGTVYLEDGYMNQSENWVGSHSAPASANTDKELQTNFGALGMDYQFNSDWGAALEFPYWDRLFRTDIGTPAAPDVTSFRHSALGDIRLTGRYTGFSSDLSTGLTLGLKLPTGDWTYPNLDRDSSIGTGTANLLLGGYHVGTLSDNPHLKWFAEVLLDRAFNTREGYRTGNEIQAALGALYDGIQLGQLGTLATLLQLIGSDRLHDSGANANPANSGYHRRLLSPGVEASFGQWSIYGDAEYRLYHYANAASSVAVEGTQGQLVAPVLLKFMLSYHLSPRQSWNLSALDPSGSVAPPGSVRPSNASLPTLFRARKRQSVRHGGPEHQRGMSGGAANNPALSASTFPDI